MDQQSQDTNQQVAPAASPQPPVTTPVQDNSVSPQAPKNKKPLVIAAIIAVVVVVLVIVVVILSSALSVSKADYREALNKYDDLRSANSTLASKVSSLSYGISTATDTSFKNNIEAVEEGLDEIKVENEELSKLKAVRVGEGAEVYKAFDEKLEAYLTYSNDLVESIKNVREPLVECNDATKAVSSSTDRSAAAAAIKVCTDKIDNIKSIPDKDMKTFIDTFGTSLEKLSTIINQLSGITDPYGAQYDQYKALRDQTYDAQDELRNASKDLTSNLQKHGKDVNPKEKAEDLSEFLVEKSSK